MRPRQVQDFIPTPMSMATAMYYTGLDPFTRQPVYTAKDLREKKLLALASGERAIRFRMPLNVSAREVDLALERIAACLPARRVAV